MPNVRVATIDDLEALKKLGEAFFNASGYGDEMEFKPDDFEGVLTTLIESGTLLTDGKDGMIGFVLFPAFVNHSHIMAQELFWWVNEDARGNGLALKLLRSAERVAAKMGAKELLMLSLSKLDGERVNRLYEARGYTPRETTYMRYL